MISLYEFLFDSDGMKVARDTSLAFDRGEIH